MTKRVTTQPRIYSSPSKYEAAVFVSYAWGGESERTVDELEQAFVKRGIRIVRDKKDLGYKDSIDTFEERIGQAQYIILVISDRYLRSEHCMHELLEVGKNQQLRERIFPIVLSDAGLYKPIDRLAYIQYWDEEVEKLNDAIKQIDVIANMSGIIADLDKYTNIRANFEHLTDLISDMNALTPEAHAADDFTILINAIESAMLGRKKLPRTGKEKVRPEKALKKRVKQSKNRDDFSISTKRVLAERVHYLCSNPDCGRPTIGPSSDPNKSVKLGVAAHITAAARGGKRFDPNLTPIERASQDNGIWLCQNCAKLIDSDEYKYTIKLLHTWKQGAETKISRFIEGSAKFSLAGASAVVSTDQPDLLDQLTGLLTGEMEKDLEQKRLEWRSGKTEIVREWLSRLKRDTDQWHLLDNKIQAKILRFEAGLELDTKGDSARAKLLANDAFVLDPSRENEARVRALIARYEQNIELGISYLQNLNDIDSRNLLASLYLETNNLAQCQDVLLEIEEKLTPNAETHRLKALQSLAVKDIAQARTEITMALATAPDWTAVKFAEAIINYFSALSPAILPNQLTPWPEPVDWIMVKRDSDSVQQLRTAARLFGELLKVEEKEAEIELLQAWQLACIMIDPDRQEDAFERAGSILKATPSNHYVIAWVTSRNYNIDLSRSRKALSELVSSRLANIPQIIALVAILVKQKNYKKAKAILLESRKVFEVSKVESLWDFWNLQVLLLAGKTEDARQAIRKSEDDNENRQTQVLLLLSQANETKDRTELIQYLENEYEATKDPILLLQACETEFRNQNWGYVSERAQLLIETFQTAEILRFAVIAVYNSRELGVCLQLIDDYQRLFGNQGLPVDIRRIRAESLQADGRFKDAIAEIDALPQDQQSLLQKAQIYFQMGDLKNLSLLGRQLVSMPKVNPENALAMARILRQEDPALAQSLWKMATSQNLPDEAIPSAFFIGYNLGLDKELEKISRRFFDAARKGVQGIWVSSLEEFQEFSQRFNLERVDIETSYKNGIIPIHFLAERQNVLLVDLYHEYLVEKETKPDPLRQGYLLIRHGGKKLDSSLIANSPNWRVHLDITSVLLAEHLNILDIVEKVFGPLHIAPELIPYLVDMRDKVLPHQPSQLENSEQIMELVAIGKLKPLDGKTLQGTTSLDRDPGETKEKDILFEFAKDHNGYVLDFVSNFSVYLEYENRSTVPFLVSGKDIVVALLENGKLSSDEYQKTIRDLGNEGLEHQNTVIPQIGSAICCVANVVDVLAGAGLLKPASEYFELYIQRDHLARIENTVRYYKKRTIVFQWLGNLIERLRAGLVSGRYAIIPVQSEKDKTKPRVGLPSATGLQTLMEFLPKDNDVIWVDDRYINGFSNRSGIPLIGVSEIVLALKNSGEIDEAQYYSLLIRIRASNLRFISTGAGEIIYWLQNAIVRDGELVETPELSILRHDIAATLLQGSILQRAPMPEGAPVLDGEISYILELINSFTDAIAQIWTLADIELANKKIYSEWIIKNLYGNHLGLFETVGIETTVERGMLLTALSLAVLIYRIASMDILSQTSPISQAYMSWLYDRVLGNYTYTNYLVLKETVALLKQLLINARTAISVDVPPKKLDFLFKKLCSMLPDPIFNELNKDASFMSSLGFEATVKLGEFDIRPDEFWKAAHESLNNQDSEVMPVNLDHRVLFKRFNGENGKFGISIYDPATNANQYILGAELELLNDAKSIQKDVLVRNKWWFDCPDNQLDMIISRILAAESPQERFESALEWRDANLDFYYSNLFKQLRDQKDFSSIDLIPRSIDGMIRHYRLTTFKGDEQSFENVWADIAKELISSYELKRAVYYLWCIPVPLPKIVSETIRSLAEDEKRALVKMLLQDSRSPTSLIHIIRLLFDLGIDTPKYRRLANLKLQFLLTKDFNQMMAAFLVVLKWINANFSLVDEFLKLSEQVRLVSIWGHAHHLFSIFSLLGASNEWIQETFSKTPFPKDVFESLSNYESDVAHPKNVNPVNFVLQGSVYCTDGFAKPVNKMGLEKIEELATMRYDGAYIPSPLLLHSTNQTPNLINAFLGNDLSKGLIKLVGTDHAESFDQSNLSQFALVILNNLRTNLDDQGAWISFHAFIGISLQTVEWENEYVSAICGVDFARLFSQDLALGALAIRIATVRTPRVQNNDFSIYLRKQVVESVRLVANLYGPANISRLNEEGRDQLNGLCASLLDTAINLAKMSGTPEDRVIAFGDICKEIVIIWNYFAPIAMPIVESFCEILPPDQAKHMWKLLFFLRAF